jgi:succinoglycan biosynthesis transport protein ExoP
MGDGTSLLQHYVGLLKRRKWWVLAPLVLVPAIALALVLRQHAVYEASSQVLLDDRSLAQALSGMQPTELTERSVATQARLARLPVVAADALRRVPGNGMTTRELLENSATATEPDSDLLELSVRAPSARLATRLATAYANAYTRFRRTVDRRTLERAQAALARELRAKPPPELAAALIDRREQLDTLAAFRDAGSSVVRPADEAVQVEPRPARSLALGLALGLVFGIGLALLWEELDTRVRSADELSKRLGVPLLARLPSPGAPGSDELVSLGSAPRDVEPFRILRANIELLTLGGVRTIMVTSALDAEGKSTTVANLAVELARVGAGVALCDFDGRAPALHRFFGIEASPGVVDVVLGSVPLDEALVPIPLRARTPGDGSERGWERAGTLHVLPFGEVPADSADLVLSVGTADLLESMAERVDIVLIDAPPLLLSGEAVALTSKVDAMVVVANLQILRRPTVAELGRLLSAARATTLGVAVTGVAASEIYGYGRSGDTVARNERLLLTPPDPDVAVPGRSRTRE